MRDPELVARAQRAAMTPELASWTSGELLGQLAAWQPTSQTGVDQPPASI